MWLEGRIAGEYLALVRAPVFRGEGVPHGRGQPVLLVPGFLAGDWSLTTLRSWARRVGYQPELAGINFNVQYSEIVLEALQRRLEDLHRAGAGKVHLVGHSRGGVLAKVLADRNPDLVEQVVALGSPLSDSFDVHPFTMAGVRAAHLFNVVRYRRRSHVEGGFLRELAARPAVPVTSLYSRSDGILNWRACVRHDLHSLEVSGSHVGLAVNPEVYRILAHLLAGGWKA